MPNDTRIAFYRAHTLWAMHRFEDAYAAYDIRLNMANVSRSNPVSQHPMCSSESTMWKLLLPHDGDVSRLVAAPGHYCGELVCSHVCKKLACTSVAAIVI